MKLQSANINVESRGIVESTNFNIETSAKAFIILSDSLYSNKIKAVIRELSTNASDSHLEKGNPERPFEVHLPTEKEPFFYVRDYGVSLTHENCMSLYQTYFKSTKTDTNDLNGCLGLGSKSPFAYSDSFMVQAYLNGVARTYAAYVGDRGVPNFDLLSEHKTDQEDGLRVQVPVQSVDINKFHAEASSVYRFFDVKPNIIGGYIAFEEPIIKEDKYDLYENESRNYIVMGQIGYPIDTRQCGHEVATVLDRYRGFTGLFIKVDIGSLDITPSRESLSYNKTTIENIKLAVNDVIKDLESYAQKEIDKEPTLHKARLKTVSLTRCGITSILRNITWNNLPVFLNVGSQTFNIDLSIGELTKYYLYGATLRSSNMVNEDSTGVQQPLVFNQSSIVYDDDNGKFAHNKIKKYLKENRNVQKVYYYSGGDLKHLLKILGDMEESEVVKLSELPRKHTVVTANRGGSIKCYKFDTTDLKFVQSKMSVKYQDAHYFYESKDIVRLPNSTCYISSFATLIKGFHGAGFDCNNFFLIKPGIINSNKLADRKNWSNGAETILDYSKELLKKVKIDPNEILYDSSLRSSDANLWFSDTNEFINDIKSKYEEHKEAFSKVRKLLTQKSNSYVYEYILSNILKVDIKDFTVDLDTYIKENYPLLEVLNTYINKELKLGRKYIASMDELRELKKERELCNT